MIKLHSLIPAIHPSIYATNNWLRDLAPNGVYIANNIYDLTEFLEEHPARPQSILDLAGKDGTKEFDEVHTRAMLDDFDTVGELDV